MTCVNDVSSLVGQFASPCTRMSMRPTPFGLLRARRDVQADAGGNAVAVRSATTTVTFGPATMLMTRVAVSAPPARVGRDDDDDETVERRVGGVDRLEVAADRRVAQTGAERAGGRNRDGLVARRLPVNVPRSTLPFSVTPADASRSCSALAVVQPDRDEHRVADVDQRADERRIDDDRSARLVLADVVRRRRRASGDRNGGRGRQSRVAARDEHDPADKRG